MKKLEININGETVWRETVSDEMMTTQGDLIEHFRTLADMLEGSWLNKERMREAKLSAIDIAPVPA